MKEKKFDIWRQDFGESSLVLDGKPLIICLAVTRNTIDKKNEKHEDKKDKRNLFLAEEGVIKPGSDESWNLPEIERQRRAKMWQEKKIKLANPNYHISKTRLSVRGIPKNISEIQLREMFKNGASSEEDDRPPGIKQVKIVRDRLVLDENGEPKSKGFGFVEFYDHVHALNAIHNLNNSKGIFEFAPERTLAVEFALENLQVLRKREKRIEVQKKKYINTEKWKDTTKSKIDKNMKQDIINSKLNNKRKRSFEDTGKKKIFFKKKKTNHKILIKKPQNKFCKF